MTKRDDAAILDRVSRAIWAAEWEDPYPRPGTIERAIAEQMAKAAIRAMAYELLAQ